MRQSCTEKGFGAVVKGNEAHNVALRKALLDRAEDGFVSAARFLFRKVRIPIVYSILQKDKIGVSRKDIIVKKIRAEVGTALAEAGVDLVDRGVGIVFFKPLFRPIAPDIVTVARAVALGDRAAVIGNIGSLRSSVILRILFLYLYVPEHVLLCLV